MSAELDTLIVEWKARQDIYECIMRYCRGIDRLDRKILASAYHHDAVDDHGTFVGPVSGFIDWVLDLHATHQQSTQHHITNHICEIDGDIAHAETYYIFRCLNRQAPFHNTSSGRYLDRLERRDGRWAIATRICLVDIRDDIWDPAGDAGDGTHQTTARDGRDPSYHKPFMIDPVRFTK